MPAINVFPLDAVAGSPSYTGEMLRQTLGALAAKGSSRPLGALTGVLPGPAAGSLFGATSTVWVVNPFCAILDLETSATAGPYLVAINTAQSGSVNAANATYPRIDLVELQLSDPAEGDGTVTPGAALVYKAGTASASPVAPTVDARSLALGTIYVPAAGGGSPSVTWIAPASVAAGGVLPCAGSSFYPAAPYDGLLIYDTVLNGLLIWNGTRWCSPALSPITIKDTGTANTLSNANPGTSVNGRTITNPFGTGVPFRVKVSYQNGQVDSSGVVQFSIVSPQLSATKLSTAKVNPAPGSVAIITEVDMPTGGSVSFSGRYEVASGTITTYADPTTHFMVYEVFPL